jgi:hypothetical protein
VAEDGSWDSCPNDLDCEFSHTLLECIYHPILYKQAQCPDATPDQLRKCLKRDELCTLYHSQQEKSETLDQVFNPNKYIENSSILRMYVDTVNRKLEKKEPPSECEQAKVQDFEASS